MINVLWFLTLCANIASAVFIIKAAFLVKQTLSTSFLRQQDNKRSKQRWSKDETNLSALQELQCTCSSRPVVLNLLTIYVTFLSEFQ